MHERNSNPDREFSNANLERFLSKVEDPAIILFLSNKEMWEKVLSSLIIIPLKPPSLIKVFEPAPNTLILLILFTVFKKKDNSFKFLGLNIIFAGPPKLHH